MENMCPIRSFDARVNAHRGSVIVAQGDAVYELGEIESLIWNMCDGTNTAEDIAQQLASQYEIDHLAALSEVLEFLAELSQSGLIEKGQ
jgi:hypothetical protein